MKILGILLICALGWATIHDGHFFHKERELISGKQGSISIDKITMAINDMDGCKKFYAETLGLKFKPVEFQGFTLFSARSGGIEWLLCPRQLAKVDKTINNNTVQIRVKVKDIERAFADGLKHGGKKITAPQKVGKMTLAGIRDPDGNSLEIVEVD